MLAPATVGAVEIRIIDVREGCRLELGVFHPPKVAPVCCGLLLYKSYSMRRKRTLYNSLLLTDPRAQKILARTVTLIWRKAQFWVLKRLALN
jgi:hypothetical protein